MRLIQIGQNSTLEKHMSAIDIAAENLKRNLEMVTMTLADFSDVEFMVRPCSGANHTTWQLGHLISSEAGIVNTIKPGAVPPAPESFIKKFTKETVGNDDPGFFPKREALLAELAKTRAATIAWVKSLTEADFAKPGPEQIKRFVPTLGDLPYMAIAHACMHMGQFQVIRRKLGKPILF
jgi:hypothetical protein